jgi:hypothetical protein
MNPVQKKFDEIHADLEANVTKIYMRRELMTAFDLVAHSVIQFPFQGDIVRKGWVEALVVGDTRCGKSETSDRLSKHFKAGELVTGENASYAGLIGGMQQTQKTWSITWGKLPLNDRRMCILDEASGLDPMTISKMSGVRSSGVAEIIKIQTERTLARVRLLWQSNPRGKRPLAAFNSGIDAIQDLIGHPEDIARFDFAMTVASGEVPMNVINAKTRPTVPHVYTSKLCNWLIYFAWSRKPHQVQFAKGAEDACLSLASDLSRRYVPPLVEGAEQRIKLARLAVAAAARVFSTNAGGDIVIVTPHHVEFVAQFLDAIYTKPSMAFDLYSKAKIAETELENPSAIQTELERHPAEFISLLSEAPIFTVNDLQDYASCSREDAVALASFLVRRRCARKGKFGYYKLPAFIRFLRHFKKGKKHRQPGDDEDAGSGGAPF